MLQDRVRNVREPKAPWLKATHNPYSEVLLDQRPRRRALATSTLPLRWILAARRTMSPTLPSRRLGAKSLCERDPPKVGP